MKYLIPLDSSQASLAPIEQLERSAHRGAQLEVVLLNVQPRFNRHISQFTRKIDRDAWRAERSRRIMAEAAGRLSRAGIPFRQVAEIGDRAERIAAVAASERVDLVLRGDGRQDALERYAFPAGIAGLAALILAAD